MPFLEFLFGLITLAIALAFIGFCLAFYGLLFVGIFTACLFLGWIPILACLSDPDMTIGVGFMGTWALWSLYLYGTIAALAIGLRIFWPDPDGLPPALKFLSLFYRLETVMVARTARTQTNTTFDGRRFRKAVNQAPSSVFETEIETRQLEQVTRKLKAERSRLCGAVAASEAAIELEMLKARQATLESFLRSRQ
ncbi:hypothetical protein [Nitratireductor sp. XY-223]|uniref:hypothetical protein n=1 Tax=Nitratireductor sp. XY-223 TaxID=2561926 RepID=UPI0010AA0010|nr:hypothetical protein [Nitratireductor sp. XY-223]